MAIPSITPLPPAPSRGSDYDTFVAAADLFLGALPDMADELNAAFEAIPEIAAATNYNTTSTSSVAIGTGSKSFSVPVGSLLVVGQFIIIASSASPENYMRGQVESHDTSTGALVVEVTSAAGAGTFDDWTISLTPIGTAEFAIPYVIDGGGAAITTGLKGGIYIPFGCTIIGWTLGETAGVSGAIVIDVWRDTHANYPPSVADTIAGTEKPTIVATGNKGQDLSLSTWTTDVPAGSWLYFNVDSVTNVQRVALTLHCLRNG